MSEIQLKAIQKATETFLQSQTSTLRGINKAVKNMQNSLKATYSDMNKPLSDRDAEKLYSYLENKDLRGTVERIGASTLWAKTIQAKELGKSENEFINLFKNTADIRDKDVREDLERIYKDYFM